MDHVSKRLLAALALAVALTACASDDGIGVSAGAKSGGITANNTPPPNGDQGGSDTGSGGAAGNGDSGNGSDNNGTTVSDDGGSGSQPKPLLAVSGGVSPRNGAVTVNALGTAAGTTLTTGAPANLLSGPLAASGNLLPAGLLDTVGATVNGAVGGSGNLGLGLTGPLGLNANGAANASSSSAGAQGNAGLLGTDVVSGVTHVLNATPLGSATGALNGITGNNNGLVSGTVASQPVLSANQPLLGVSAASSTQNTGSLLSAGAASGGYLVSVGTPLPGANTLLGGTGYVLGGVTGAANGDAVGTVLNGVTNAAGGVTNTVGGIASGTPVGTLLSH
jgi:hypothetical protein